MIDALRRALRELDAAPRADLALRLTLIALLLEPVGGAWTRPLIALLCVAGLLSGSLRHSAGLLAALLALALWRVASAWPLGDNHGFLLVYWLLALLLASRARDGDAQLGWNARALVGLVFAFATLWKLLSPDYLDGRFFLVTLVDDARLEAFARLAAGLDGEQLAALRELVREHQDGLRPLESTPPPLPDRLVLTARSLSFGVLAFEAGLALAFLAPRRLALSRARDALLQTFCATAYAVAPVEGFGWLLLCMGVAQCAPERTTARRVYLAVFGVVLLAARWPWLAALAAWSS